MNTIISRRSSKFTHRYEAPLIVNKCLTTAVSSSTATTEPPTSPAAPQPYPSSSAVPPSPSLQQASPSIQHDHHERSNNQQHSLFPLAKRWWDIYAGGNHLKGRSPVNPTTQDLVNLANSLREDPDTFIPRFISAIEFQRKREFTPEEDRIILEFVEKCKREIDTDIDNSEKKDVKDVKEECREYKYDFSRLSDVLNRLGVDIKDRYYVLSGKKKQPIKSARTTDSYNKTAKLNKLDKAGVPIQFSNAEEERTFITNMLRVILDTKTANIDNVALKLSFYKIVSMADITATVKYIKEKYRRDELREMWETSEVCQAEFAKMKRLVVEWKLDDGTGRPNMPRIVQEFPEFDRRFVFRRVLHLYKRMEVKLGQFADFINCESQLYLSAILLYSAGAFQYLFFIFRYLEIYRGKQAKRHAMVAGILALIFTASIPINIALAKTYKSQAGVCVIVRPPISYYYPAIADIVLVMYMTALITIPLFQTYTFTIQANVVKY
ncbi:hypothetical protein HDU76_007233 [Blyttiomyces sp. JEL0837]|nr:hypothetical protein HDU76_007233 [Blyttiomyces sp. JEL0837]